ncbi:MAG: carboxypeptidase-like regulatory domain-containing protein, partial [Acidobacteriota bacterium]
MNISVIWRSLLLSCLFLGGMARAQEPVSITGKVTDAKSVPIPAATVRLLMGDQTKETLTDVDGFFAFNNLAVGVYQLVVEMPGFQKLTKDAADAAVEANRNLTIQLQATPAPPRPPKPAPARTNVARTATGQTPTGQTAADASSFQTIDTTELPGMQQFQQNSGQNGAEGVAQNTVPTRPDNSDVLVITSNSMSLDAGNIGDPGFQRQLMDGARQMGFQLNLDAAMGAQGQGGPGGGRGGDVGGGGGGGGRGGGAGGGGRGGGGGGFRMGGPGGRGAQFKQPIISGNFSETFSNS